MNRADQVQKLRIRHGAGGNSNEAKGTRSRKFRENLETEKNAKSKSFSGASIVRDLMIERGSPS